MRLKTKPGAVLSVITGAAVAAWAVFGAGAPAGAADAAGQAATTAALSGPSGTWGPGQPVPGLSALVPSGATLVGAGINAVTCTSPGNCAAVGYYQALKSGTTVLWPFIVMETAGTWGNAQQVSGVTGLGPGLTATLTHVSCGAPGYCTAAGDYEGTDSTTHVFLVTESAGAWGTATAVSDAGLGTSLVTLVTALSCPAAGDCTAVGTYAKNSNTKSLLAFTMDESDGTWGEPQPVPGLASLQPASDNESNVLSLSCAAPGDCTAGGVYDNGTSNGEPFVVSESNHIWADAQEVPGFPALSNSTGGGVTSVSCPDATDCTAVGVYGASATSEQVFTVDEVSGSWGQARPLSIPGAATVPLPGTVSCASAGNCTVTGTFTSTSSPAQREAFAASESSGGNWGTGQPISGIPAADDSYATAVSCAPAGDCTIVGFFVSTSSTLPYQEFAAVDSADSGLGAAQPVLSDGIYPRVIILDCTQSGYCTLATNVPGGPLLVSEETAATVTLRASAATLIYGDEQSETLTATVVSPAGGTLTGTVTVTDGSTAVCAITLVNGTGSCPLTARALPAGTDLLTARYSGDPGYVAASSAVTVQVIPLRSVRGLDVSPSALPFRPSAQLAGQLGSTAYPRRTIPVSARPAGSTATKPAFARAVREISLLLAGIIAAARPGAGSW